MMTLGKKENGKTVLPLGRKVIDTSFSYGRKLAIPKKINAMNDMKEEKKKSDLERR